MIKSTDSTVLDAGISNEGTIQGQRLSLIPFVFPFLMAAVCVYISFHNFLLFHTVAEFFSVVVAIIMWVVAWQSFAMTHNYFLMYLANGYFWIAVIDLMHALYYKGMGVFDDVFIAQFWIAARVLEAVLLLTAPFFLTRPIARRLTFILFGAIVVGVVATIVNGLFPVMFVDGVGLTAVKVNTEYVIIGILAAAIIHFFFNRGVIEPSIYKLMLGSIAFTMGAELAFTFYVSVYGLSNVVGHVFKLFSFWMIYAAITQTMMLRPFSAMARVAGSFDAVPDPTLVIDRDLIVRHVNHATCRVLEKSVSECLDTHCHNFFHDRDLTSEHCPVCDAIRSGQEDATLIEHVASRDQWYEHTLTPVPGEGVGRGFVQVTRNVTEHVRAQKELEESEQRFRGSFENGVLGMTMLTTDHNFLMVNTAFCEMLGLRESEIIGNNFKKFTHPDDLEENIGYLSDVEKGYVAATQYEKRFINSEGQPVPVLVSTRLVNDANGEPLYYTAQVLDLRERKKSEELLIQSAKMATLGEMASGIAHELNQPLNIIRMGAERALIKEDRSQLDPEMVHDTFLEIEGQVDRMSQIIDHMRVFARADKSDVVAFSPAEFTSSAVSFFEPQLRSAGIQLHQDIKLSSKQVLGQPVQIEQVVLNLLSNALDELTSVMTKPDVEKGFKPEISVSVFENDELDQVQVIVTDNGGGIPDTVMPNIFEPFFTTKEVGSGTGLGLSICYGIIKSMNGEMKAISQPGNTDFVITLPLMEEA